MISTVESNIPHSPVSTFAGKRSNIKIIPFPEEIAELAADKIYIIEKPIISAKGRFIFVNNEGEYHALSESANYDGVFMNATDANIVLKDIGQNKIRRNGDYALLHNRWAGAFYHWFEETIQVVVLENAGFTGTYVIPRGLPHIEKSLEMLNISKDRIWIPEEVDIEAERVWICPRFDLQQSMILRPNLLNLLREKLLNAANKSVLTDKLPSYSRLLALRGAHTANSRGIVNFDEALMIFREFDFEAVDLAKFAFDEQILIASKLNSFAGAHGAAFCHTLFSNRGINVLELFSPLYVNYTFLSIYNARSHIYTPLVSACFGHYANGRDTLVQIDALRYVLHQIR